MKRFVVPLVVVVWCAVVLFWKPGEAPASAGAAGPAASAEWGPEPIRPLLAPAGLDERKVALGERLFHDARFSRDDSISCASCHGLDTGGVDGLPVSVGVGGAVGAVNSPTVLNSGANFKQFWDGRAETLEDQVDGPTHAGNEMASSWEEILPKLAASPEYVRDFAAIYPDGITRENVRDAIATFERSLATPNSRFDRFLSGDASALTEQEKEGHRLFASYGCVACHQGAAVGGNMFQKFGVVGDYFADRGSVAEADLGRYNVTKDERDRHVFKVPSLRNVALTAPYFHDGSAGSLPGAVVTMAKYQLGRELTPDEVAAIAAFLKTLTGELKGRAL